MRLFAWFLFSFICLRSLNYSAVEECLFFHSPLWRLIGDRLLYILSLSLTLLLHYSFKKQWLICMFRIQVQCITLERGIGELVLYTVCSLCVQRKGVKVISPGCDRSLTSYDVRSEQPPGKSDLEPSGT